MSSSSSRKVQRHPDDFASRVAGIKSRGCFNQCCGTLMICCGSGSNFGKVYVPVPAAAPDHETRDKYLTQ